MKNNRFYFHAGILLAMLLIPIIHLSADAADPISRTGFFFDTIISVSLYDTQDESILDDCFKLMQYYENTLSRTRQDSDVSHINQAHGKAAEVSEDTIEVIQKALEYCALSEGALDITIAPVVSLWNFQEGAEPAFPDDEVLADALSHIDYQAVIIEGNTVTLTDPEASIDLGAIAKGYISDKLKELLIKEGCKSALINLGGNVLTVGTKPDGSAWNIGIRRPFGETAYDILDKVAVKDLSVITSGTYERYFIYDGKVFHHILDPETGYPVRNGLTSVTILSAEAADGDALSTACFVLGPEKGLELIENLEGIEAAFVDENEKITYSSGWPK